MSAAPRHKSPAPLASGYRAHENDQAGDRIDYQGNSARGNQQGALQSLASLHRSWGPPEDDQIWWLLGEGVPEHSMINPWCLGGGRVSFHGQQFDLDPDGEPTITFRAADCGVVRDLISWEPCTGKLASLYGAAFCLGDLDQIFSPATYFDGGMLRIHPTPLDWLKADRDGIVIVRHDLTYGYLRGVSRVVCTGTALADRIKRWMRVPKPITEFFIDTDTEEMTA